MTLPSPRAPGHGGHVHIHYHYLPHPPSAASPTGPLHLAMPLPLRLRSCLPRLRAPSLPGPATSPSPAQISGRQMRSLWWSKLVPVDEPHAQLHFLQVRKITWMLLRLLQH